MNEDLGEVFFAVILDEDCFILKESIDEFSQERYERFLSLFTVEFLRRNDVFFIQAFLCS